MSFLSWLRSFRFSRTSRSARRRRFARQPTRPQRLRLQLEALEDRVVPSVSMVQDIYSYTNGSDPQNLTDVNGTLFFKAYDNTNNYNLFKSDGTASGTQQLTFGNNLSSIGNLVNLNGKLFFTANDNVLNGNNDLWTSDGTVAGTHPFQASGEDVIPYSSSSTQALVGSKLYFEAYDTASNQYDLWISDGNSAGTHPVQPGTTTEPINSYLSNFANVNGTLYFEGYDSGTKDYTLWKSNGTASGTVQVAELTGGYQATNFTAVGSELYFKLYDPTNSLYALWKSNGTSSGTSMVADIGTAANQFYSLTSFNNKLWFQVDDTTDAPNTSYALWSSDGTASNTGAFKFNNSTTTVQVQGNTPMVVLGSALYFNGYDTTHGYSLWKTDGSSTNNATATVQSTGASPFNQNPNYLTVVGTKLFFQAYDSSNGRYDLWKSDGTNAGTTPVQTGSSVAQGIGSYSGIVASNGKAFFTAYDVDANGSSPHSYELWSSDGTAANTAMVTDINTTTAGSNPRYLTAVGNEIFFGASNNTNVFTLYQSDGTSANTVPVQTSANVLPTGVNWNTLTAMGSNLYFTAYVPSDSKYELWSSGTATNSATPFQAGSGNAIANNPSDLVNDNGELYFFAYDNTTSKYALWKSDGTNSGTQVVADLPSGSGLGNLTVAGSNLFFQAYDTTNSTYALWESNGTTASQVQDVSPNGYAMQGSMTAVGSSVFYQVYDSTASKYALWTSNGTTTTQLMHFSSGDMNAQIAFNNLLFFDAYDSANGYNSLWISDGTVAGTQLYQTSGGIPVILGTGTPSFTIVGSELYFEDLFGVYQLGKTDGTPGGYSEVQTGSNSGTVAQNPSNLVNDNGTLVFDAYDSAHGYELWQSDGTAAGTLLTADIYPGTGSSSPSYLTVAGNQVFFNATDTSHGAELWSATLSADVVTAGLSGPTDGVTEQHRPFVLTGTDSNSSYSNDNYAFQINWGDGTSQTVIGPSGITTDHQYAAVGNYTISVTATNQGDNVTSAAYTQVENITQTELQGGNLAVGGVAGNNAFVITKGSKSGTYTVKAGTNTLLNNFAPATGEEIILYPGNGTTTATINDPTTGTQSADAFTLGGGYVTFVKATFVIPSPATWTINGNNGKDTFTVIGPATASINGGTANDTFNISNGGSLTGAINGGGGTNLLSYAKYTTSGVVVDLPLGSATGIGGGISNIQNVTGSGHGGDILVGDGHANVLTALKGHNILIGGSGGGDTLNSGGGDILIAGSTNYDTNLAALAFILSEWAPVTATTYTTVINNIETSSTDPLNGSTVTDSGSPDAADTLNGKSGHTTVADWYFAHTSGGTNPNDTMNNKLSSETVTSI